MDRVKQYMPKLVTLTLVIVALLCAYLLYNRYSERPWTRDGQVRADVVKIAPRVSGYLVKVAVQDNQSVRKGDLLFQIDPSSYQLAVDQAQVDLDQAREDVEALEAEVRAAEAAEKEAEAGVMSATALIAQRTAQLEEAKRQAERAKRLADKKAGSVETSEAKAASVDAMQAQLDSANAGLTQSQAAVVTAKSDTDNAKATLGETGEANVRIRSAKVQLEQAKLNMDWTSIYAPADGYVTNMDVLSGTFVSPGTPFALFVDASSFRVDGYFQETKLKNIQPGDRAIITLMGHHQQRLEGEVESIGYAINPPNLAETEGPDNLVPTIEPTFEWIRLAQRVPVRIRFKDIPEGLHLVSGMTASISIQK
jgi:multidrug resistance efflux pump